MPKIPTGLGNPTLPQAGGARRVASLDAGGPANALIEGSRVYGSAWHRTAAGLQDLGQAFDQLQLQQDQKEAKDWLNQLLEAKTNLLYGDGTAENPGYINTKGDAAVKGAKPTAEQLDKLREQFLAQTSNKQVSTLFDAASSQLIAPDKEEILKHASKENLVALDATDDATMAAATDQMASNPTSDQVVYNSTMLLAGSVTAKMNRAGIVDPVVINQGIMEAVSAAKTAAIQTALVRDPASGAALYAKWKDQIQGTDQAKLEQSIVAAEDRAMRKQEHAAYMDEHYKKIASDKAQSDYAHAIILHAADPTKYPAVSLEQIGTDPRLQGPDVLTLYNMQKAADDNDTPTNISRATLASLMPRLTARYGDPTKITTYKEINELMATKQLTKADWTFAASIIETGKTEEGGKLSPYIDSALKTALKVIGKPDPITGLPSDNINAANLNDWTYNLYQQIDQFKQANKDPRELFNPKSKDYVLSPEVLSKYHVSMQDVMNEMNQSLGAGSEVVPSDNLPTDNMATIPTVKSADDYAKIPPGGEYLFTGKDGKTVKLKKAQ